MSYPALCLEGCPTKISTSTYHPRLVLQNKRMYYPLPRVVPDRVAVAVPEFKIMWWG